MAQQKANSDKPNFKSYKDAKDGGKEVRSSQVKKFKSEGKKRGPKEIDMRGTGNTQKCPPLCRCVTCLIAIGNAENARRMNQDNTGYYRFQR